MNGDTLNAGRVSVRRRAFFTPCKEILWRELMKKLGILLLAAAFAVCGLMTFAACNEETLDPGDDPIVTPEPDEPGKPEEPEATEGLVFELITTENSDGFDGFEEFFGEGFEDFYVCTGLTVAEENVVIPSTYNGLPVRAFSWYGMEDDILSGITSFYIPDSVQVVQWDMWGEYEIFENLTDIRLPRNPNAMISGGIYLSGCAFYNDPNNWEDGALYMDDWLLATNDDLPEEYAVKQGTVGIAAGAFLQQEDMDYKSHVRKVTVPDGVQALFGSFSRCVSLEEVLLPDSLSFIGMNAFWACYSLTSVTIPDSVTAIGDWAFYYCSSLESITIPDSVTSIGDSAFVWCHGLTSIVIPDSVASIGDSAFGGCSSLTCIVIPDSVISIGDEAFAGCDSLTSITVDAGNTVYHSDGNCLIETQSKTLIAGCGTSVIPSDGSVTSIGEGAFSNCESLMSITIPDSVTVIGDKAFLSCRSLESVMIPDSVTSIGDLAFKGCHGLTSITIPDSVTFIGYGAFSETAYNNASNWEDGVLYIGNHLIGAEETISGNFSVREGTKTIAGEAFSSCRSLESVMIPDSVTSIGDSAFEYCSSLTSITIPGSVTFIGGGAFEGCSSLENVAIPDSVISIGDFAFAGCGSLTSIVIPDSVTSIGDGAFAWCSGLTSITIPDSVTSIGDSAFEWCSGLTSVTMGDNVTSIGDGAFDWCSSLETVYYRGSEEEWNEIEIGADNDDLLNAEIIFNYTGE
ncbi:MAG: hypothetical protein DBX60_01835 [Bacillota bacterium]|nr:MAG: hypothetical protein DBX60_01835 [Bacillota bacterium]